MKFKHSQFMTCGICLLIMLVRCITSIVMHCFYDSLEKKMPFISEEHQASGQEGEGRAALTYVPPCSGESILGACQLLRVCLR